MKALAVVFLVAALGASPALAGPLDQSCLVGKRPAASLLIPYFEVDLANADGITTLASVGNAHSEPILARVVVWTDWGLSTINFDLALDAGQVQSLNMRAILAGQVPLTGAGLEGQLDAPSCTFPISPPPFNLEELQTRHTGQPSPETGLCYGSGRQGPETATGYLTVDVVRDCSIGAIPGDDGYFDDGEGLATNDNFLFGEFFLLEPGQDFAQGLNAVSLVADTDLFQPSATRQTFYSNRGLVGDADDRMPLTTRHRGRFFNGGGFDGSTDLLIWNAGIGSDALPKSCGSGPFDDASFSPYLGFELMNEAGEMLDHVGFIAPAVTFRVPIGGEEIPIDPGTFGIVETNANLFCNLIFPCVEPLQSWVASLIRAQGRYSVGVEAARLVDPCQ